jgi:hypothetical protein
MVKTSQTFDSNELSRLVCLQIIVLTLGQPKHLGWWKSEFLSPTGLRILQRIYPRDFFWAAVRSSAAAAKEIHDSAIGVRDAFHLFRLPGHMGTTLHIVSALNEFKIEDEVTSILEDRSQLLVQLETLAESSHLATHVGPVRLGTEKDLGKPEIVSQLADYYHSAFQHNTKVFPYFEHTSRKR